MPIGTVAIKSERHVRIAAVIRRDAKIIIDRWVQRAIQEQPHATRVHHMALLDHLPALLEALGRSLAETEDPETSQHFIPATIHGEQRWEAGWSLSEVVRDYQILRVVILDYLNEIPEISLYPRSVLAIGLALDEAIAASVAAYLATRDENVRRLEAERVQQEKLIQDHLAQKAEVLQEVDRRKNEFLAVLGHEMRNPLAPLAHAARLLELRRESDPQVDQICDIVNRQVQQLSRLADDLLDISRIAQGKTELRMELTPISQIVARAVQTSAPHIKARHQQLDVRVPEEPLVLRADPARATQILVNLLNNAAKYTPPNGHITLTVAAEPDSAVIRICDDGIGISKDMLPHVFELFTQGEWAPGSSNDGMGIGLALVRRLVELHGGTISVFSPGLGRGSEFLIRLPVARPAALDEQPEGFDQGDGKTRAEPALRPRRILVVDDNLDSAQLLCMLLTRAGHETRSAHDGPATLAVVPEFKPDIVLLDIGLPMMDGYEVTRRLRAHYRPGELFVVALTGYGQEDDKRQSRDAGCNAHLVKPVDLGVLERLIATVPS